MLLLRFAIIFFVGLLSVSLAAQEKVIYDLLYLNDGSFLKGNVAAKSNNIIRWQLTNGEIVQIALTHIDHIQKGEQELLVFPNGKSISEKGNYHLLFSGLLFGKGEGFREDPSGINLIHFIKGIKFNQFLSVGLGTGLDFYDHEFVPLYLDFRGDILDQPIAPYYALNLGYGFSFDMSDKRSDITYKGGVMIHPAIGVRFATKKKTGYLLEVGYKFQNGKIEYENREYTDQLTYRRLSLRAGISF